MNINRCSQAVTVSVENEQKTMSSPYMFSSKSFSTYFTAEGKEKAMPGTRAERTKF